MQSQQSLVDALRRIYPRTGGLFSFTFQISFCRQNANRYCAALADSDRRLLVQNIRNAKPYWGLESCKRRFHCAVWVRSCRTTLPFWLKRLGHMEQAYGFSPVWVRSCLGTLLLTLKRLGHMEQA